MTSDERQIEFRTADRPRDALQEPVSLAEIQAIVRRALGKTVEVKSAQEYALGSYNTSLRLDLTSGTAVVLRIAPRTSRQLRSERNWLRSEYAAAAYLVGLGDLVPKVLAADFTQELIERDYLIETLVPGLPAPARLPSYDRALWPGFFRQLGAIARRINEVTGESFGPLAAPVDSRWSDALLRSLDDSLLDLRQLSLPAGDIATVAEAIERNRGVLDAVEPRLLHGDLWTANVILDPAADEPSIVGVLDSERAWWGDPLADWAIFRADTRPIVEERQSFFAGYGTLGSDGNVDWRLALYRARHLIALRIEAGRNGHPDRVAETVDEAAAAIAEII